MVDQSFRVKDALDPMNGVIRPSDHCVLRIRSELVAMAAWALGSRKSTNEQFYGTNIVLCGSMVIELAVSMPFSLHLCTEEKASSLPWQASTWNQIFSFSRISASESI